jgi:hypothetical protein
MRPADEARAAVAVQEAALARMRLQREAVELQRQYDQEDREREAAEEEAVEEEARAVRAQHAAHARAAANAKRVAYLRGLASIVYVPFDLPEAKREVTRLIANIDASMDESVCDDIRAIVRRHQDAADTERRRQREAKAAAERIDLCVSWARAFASGETLKRAMDGAWDVTRSSDAVRAVERAVRSECRPDMTYSEVVAVAARVLDGYARRSIGASLFVCQAPRSHPRCRSLNIYGRNIDTPIAPGDGRAATDTSSARVASSGHNPVQADDKPRRDRPRRSTRSSGGARPRLRCHEAPSARPLRSSEAPFAVPLAAGDDRHTP